MGRGTHGHDAERLECVIPAEREARESDTITPVSKI
jgi:hypothetical protein